MNKKNFFNHTNLFLLAILMIFISCEKKRNPKVEIQGNRNWFHETDEEKAYLLNNFQEDFHKNINWPPDKYCKLYDISIDVTGSSYMKKVEYKGNIIPLAEYNLCKLRDYLSIGLDLGYGDKIFLRLFGENKGGTNISPRESTLLKYPKLSIELEGKILSRRHNDLQIKVIKIIPPKIDKKSFVDSIFNWFMPYVKKCIFPSNQYMNSPLFEHIKSTVAFSLNTKFIKNFFIFVTDGWVELNEFYFWPRFFDHDPNILQKIKNRVESLSLRPFNQRYPNVRIILIGLNDGGNPKYRKAQQELFNWFFSPQKISIIFF